MSRSNKLVASFTPKLHRLFGSRAGGRVGILLYHRVQPCEPALPEPSFNVTPELFREHLVGLVDAGFRFVRLADVLQAARTAKPLPPRSVVLTFDDTFESVYRNAYPILDELDIPAVAFLSTAYLDWSDPFPFDRWGQTFRGQLSPEAYRPLSVEQCRAMAASGRFELGSHTHTHHDFRGRPDDLQKDVRRSIEIIRDLFGHDEVTFAFPYGKTELGYAGGAMSDAVRKAGACCALTTDCALVDPLGDDPFTWGRFSAGSWDTAASLAAKLAGWYGWAPRLQQTLDRLRGHDRSTEYEPPLFATDPSDRQPAAIGELCKTSDDAAREEAIS